MALGCQAIWELLREHTDLEDEQIILKMEQIDLRDGVKDGEIGHKLLTCPSCRRRGNSTRERCLYCNTELPRGHVFE